MNIEEEIDLRTYIAILLKHKYWILGITAAAVVLGVIASPNLMCYANAFRFVVDDIVNSVDSDVRVVTREGDVVAAWMVGDGFHFLASMAKPAKQFFILPVP